MGKQKRPAIGISIRYSFSRRCNQAVITRAVAQVREFANSRALFSGNGKGAPPRPAQSRGTPPCTGAAAVWTGLEDRTCRTHKILRQVGWIIFARACASTGGYQGPDMANTSRGAGRYVRTDRSISTGAPRRPDCTALCRNAGGWERSSVDRNSKLTTFLGGD